MTTIPYTNIEAHLEALLRELSPELDPRNVKHIDFTPTAITVTAFGLNEEGRKYINLDTGNVVTYTQTFKLTHG